MMQTILALCRDVTLVVVTQRGRESFSANDQPY